MFGNWLGKKLRVPQPAASPLEEKSIFFYTLHKCASSLFSSKVLPRVGGGLRHVDYAAKLYTGEVQGPLSFKETGVLYGPIRVVAPDLAYPEYRWLVEPLTRPGFVCQRKSVIFLRDPRDVLISIFFSFGFSHDRSPVPSVAALQEKRRKEIQAMGLEKFCEMEATKQKQIFDTLARLKDESAAAVVIRYEDLFSSFDTAVLPLKKALMLDEDTIDAIREEFGAVEEENPMAHRRSGRPGAFREKLGAKCVSRVTEILGGSLEKFGYE
jgi:hypothetical protein